MGLRPIVVPSNGGGGQIGAAWPRNVGRQRDYLRKPVSIARFIKAIRALPSDEPRVDPKKWYTTQKRHWLDWLRGYHGPGAYGRRPETRRDAEYVYNHIVEVKMLLWLIHAAGVERRLVSRARKSVAKGTTLAQQSAAVRKHVPWVTVERALWPERGLGSSRFWEPSSSKRPKELLGDGFCGLAGTF